MLNSPWRDAGRRLRLGPLDALAAPPLLTVLIFPSWWTVGVALMVAGLCWWLDRRGLNFRVALLALRARLWPIRPARLIVNMNAWH